MEEARDFSLANAVTIPAALRAPLKQEVHRHKENKSDVCHKPPPDETRVRTCPLSMVPPRWRPEDVSQVFSPPSSCVALSSYSQYSQFTSLYPLVPPRATFAIQPLKFSVFAERSQFFLINDIIGIMIPFIFVLSN